MARTALIVEDDAILSELLGVVLKGMEFQTHILNEGTDAAGHTHPGLPWAGCTILTATAAELADVREKAVASEGVHVVDMPLIAQTTRVYDEFLAQLAETKPADLATRAVSIVGPRNKISKLVKRLELMP